ncbi:MAG TPA: hypothetical protein VJL90_00195 [Pseudorhodoplanes sp.]|nr:hypothetical protein [Pseudorhodoplanes sp.]
MSTLIWPISISLANESCRYLGQYGPQEPAQLEWLDGDKPYGMRLSIRDARWRLLSTMQGVFVKCESCAEVAIDYGKFHLSASPWLGSAINHWPPKGFEGLDDVQIHLHPRLITAWFRAVNHGERLQFEPTTEIAAASFGGMNGYARELTADFDGPYKSAVAFFAQGECFRVFALFFSSTGKKVAIADLATLSEAMAIERYVAVVTSEKLPRVTPPPTTEPLPLGDARKRALEGKQ